MRTPTSVEGWGQRACMRVRGDPAIATVGSVQVLGKVLGLQVRVLFCDNGVQSGQFANLLQTLGYEAYALKDGTKALRGTTP